MTPRARQTNKFFVEDVESEFIPPVKQEEPPRICKTPKGPRKDLEILIHEINDTKSTKSQSTKPKTPKPPKKMPVEENLSMTLQECIHKAMLLSQTLDLQLSQRHK